MLLKSAFVSAAFLAGSTLAVNAGDINGLSFIDSTTKGRIQIIGVDYQPGGQAGFNAESGKDVLSDGDACLRDATLLQKLGVNTIRVYNVNPTTNHDLCMSIFNAAGIYVIVDVNSPNMSINRAEPWTSYYAGYLQYIFTNIENFKNYPNTLAFFAANEVINDEKTTQFNPQYIRAVIRDMRQYIAKHSPRHIPVGYSAADVRSVLQDTFSYLSCSIDGTANDLTTQEHFGLNSYSWCGKDATFTSSGYDALVAMFKSTTVPVFYSEYGCNQPAGVPRVFNEVQALYGPQMTNLNGGLVYEYSQETSDYGLVVINSDGSINLKADYENLQMQYNKLDKTLLTTIPNIQNTVPKCDAKLITSSGFSTNWTLPTQPPGSADLFANGVPNPPSGKLVDVTNLSVKQKVFTSSGSEMKGLVLNKVSGSNLPSGQTAANSTSGGSSSGGSTKKGSASAISMSSGLILVAGVVGTLFAFV